MDISKNYVVSGQIGFIPLLCVWDPDTCKEIIVFKEHLRNGIGNIAISPNEDMIAARCLD